MRTCILVLSDHFQRLQRRMLELLLLFFENTRKYNSDKSQRKNLLEKTKYLSGQKISETLLTLISGGFLWFLRRISLVYHGLELRKNFDLK